MKYTNKYVIMFNGITHILAHECDNKMIKTYKAKGYKIVNRIKARSAIKAAILHAARKNFNYGGN